MCRKLIAPTLLLLLGTACHRSNASMQREQQQYQVVQEGSTSGASTTINAPGETPPPAVGTTSVGTTTSVDTTTNFALSTRQPSSTAAPGTLAATLEPAGGSTSGGVPSSYMPSPDPAARRTPPRQQRIYIAPSTPHPAPATTTAGEPDSQVQPPATDTTSSASSATVNTSTTSTSGAKRNQKKSDTSPQTDTPPPPPPPATDTTGTFRR